ncbi:TetR/AcrR family transcriptional regulator [Shewanella maritima]|uniref:TetR/AcrR family transcriptional regulator n=1 Tax=Shewanella maritima TaxID=2520507 RepID=UPI003735263C
MSVGRPVGETDNRAKLINAARTLFIDNDYSQVTLRQIARLAGTDPGLIRYYFGAKDQLFVSMIKETAQPVIDQLNAVHKMPQAQSPAKLLSTYYQVMAKNPQFPRLMYRILNMQHSGDEFPDTAAIFNFIHQEPNMFFFDKLKQQGVLRDDVDAKSAQLSFMSLMIFPFLVPQHVTERMGLKLTPEFFTQLAQQNINLLQRGLLKKDAIHEH